MPNRRIDFTIQEGLPSPLPEDLLRRATLAALDVAFPDRDCQLTLALCDDDTIRALNANYRGVDKITDVLAFSTNHPGPWQGDDDFKPTPDETYPAFPTPPNEPPDLGDVVVCFPPDSSSSHRRPSLRPTGNCPSSSSTASSTSSATTTTRSKKKPSCGPSKTTPYAPSSTPRTPNSPPPVVASLVAYSPISPHPPHSSSRIACPREGGGGDPSSFPPATPIRTRNSLHFVRPSSPLSSRMRRPIPVPLPTY